MVSSDTVSSDTESVPPVASVPWQPYSQRLGAMVRTALILGGLMPVSLLVTAAALPPSPSGLGTHQQLGLPPCSLRQLADLRCPSCGMTTSWARMMRGQVLGAFSANTGGALLALAAAIGGPWAIASGIRGRWVGGTPNEWLFAGISLGIMAITLCDWGVRLYMESH
jgi:hypothetical protein